MKLFKMSLSLLVVGLLSLQPVHAYHDQEYNNYNDMYDDRIDDQIFGQSDQDEDDMDADVVQPATTQIPWYKRIINPFSYRKDVVYEPVVEPVADERSWYQRINPFSSADQSAADNDAVEVDDDMFEDQDDKEVADQEVQEEYVPVAVVQQPVIEQVAPVAAYSVVSGMKEKLMELLVLVQSENRLATFVHDALYHLSHNNMSEVKVLMAASLQYIQEEENDGHTLAITVDVKPRFQELLAQLS